MSDKKRNQLQVFFFNFMQTRGRTLRQNSVLLTGHGRPTHLVSVCVMSRKSRGASGRRLGMTNPLTPQPEAKTNTAVRCLPARSCCPLRCSRLPLEALNQQTCQTTCLRGKSFTAHFQKSAQTLKLFPLFMCLLGFCCNVDLFYAKSNMIH